MSKLDKIIHIVGKVNELDRIVVAVVIVIICFPLIVLCLLAKEICELIKSIVCHKKESEKEKIKQGLKSGEIRLRDLPHGTPTQFETFNFEEVTRPRYKRNVLFYVNSEEDSTIRTFLNDEREWIEDWTWKYGFKIELVQNQGQFLNQMCYPQDKVFLKHGFLRDLNCWSADHVYGVSVMPFKYYELKEGSTESLKNQLENLAQDIYDE